MCWWALLIARSAVLGSVRGRKGWGSAQNERGQNMNQVGLKIGAPRVPADGEGGGGVASRWEARKERDEPKD